MPSAIDPSKPAQGTPVAKSDIRANWSTIQTEMNHGGFNPDAPNNYMPSPEDDKVQSHLAGIDKALGMANVMVYGAVGDGVADDTAAKAR